MLENRGSRRDRTLRAATRAWKVWAARFLVDPTKWGFKFVDGVRVPIEPDPLDWCVGRYRKGKSLGCNCRGRKHGQPKRGGGICTLGWRPSAKERVAGKQLCAKWRVALQYRDPEDIEL